MRVRALLAGFLVAGTVAVPHGAIAARDRFGAVVAPLRLIPLRGAPLSVEGLHRYYGTVEIASAGDGLVVSNRLPLERYLWGLNEVPPTWPFEALRAQAVAARTYALHTLAGGRAGEGAVYGYDICATVQCQVFSGADVVASAGGRRWMSAIEDTAGIAATYAGVPILARYHSVSGGQTLDNEDAFPEEPAYPYLKAVPSPHEGASPLFRWTATFPLGHVQTMLARAGWWDDDNGKLLRVTSSGDPFGVVRLRFEGKRGDFSTTADSWRDSLRDLAPALWPGDYPAIAPTGSGRLPETLPSHRISVITRKGAVQVVGRGWGHGSGMSQWGAYGMAMRGATYQEILGHYYSGISLSRVDTGREIEVGVATQQRSVTVEGAFRLVDGNGRTVVDEALGHWVFGWPGAGAVSIQPPRGFGLPLRVAIVRAPRRVELGDSVDVTVALSRPARIRLRTAGAPLEYSDPGTRVEKAGRRELTWHAPLQPGTVTLRVEALAEGARKVTAPVEIDVFERRLAAGDGAGRSDAPSDEQGGNGAWLVLAVAGLLVGAVLIAVAGGGKQPPPQGPSVD